MIYVCKHNEVEMPSCQNALLCAMCGSRIAEIPHYYFLHSGSTPAKYSESQIMGSYTIYVDHELILVWCSIVCSSTLCAVKCSEN